MQFKGLRCGTTTIVDIRWQTVNHLIPILKSFKLATLSENFIKKYRGKVDPTSIKVNACLLILSAEVEYSLKKSNFPVKILKFRQS